MKLKARILCVLLVLITLLSIPFAASAATTGLLASVTAKGFTVSSFSPDTHYYLCTPSTFSGCSFTALKPASGAAVSDIAVEQYCEYVTHPKVGETFNLGYGRARITVTVQIKVEVKVGDKTETKTETQKYLFALTDPKQDTYYYAFVSTPCYVYKSTSTDSTKVEYRSAGTTNSTMLFCVGTSGSWTHVVLPGSSKSGKDGWIKTENLTRGFATCSMPSTYQSKLVALQKAHPNWHFTFISMGTDLATYAAKVKSQVASDAGKTVTIDEIVQYMNPTHYFDETKIFAFLDVSRYNKPDYNNTGLTAIWKSRDGAVITQSQAASYFAKAGASLRMNPYFLAERSSLETGYGTSALSKGKVGTDGNKYYNFYGIRAFDKDPGNGAVYAEQRGWDSPLRAIVEGGNWINDQYIQRGQCTPYFLRYYTYRSHSYMTDLAAPDSDAIILARGYKNGGTLDGALHFIIPVYGYTDVPVGAWYYNDVYKSTDYGLFSGMGDGTFAPNSSFTRAQFVTVLSRLNGADTTGMTTTQFADVSKKAWYAGAVAWAVKAGVTNGVSPNRFAPNSNINRQELCTMLARFAEAQKAKLPTGSLKFTDTDQIAAWATDAVSHCVGAGLVAGMPNGSFDPTGNATRAQGAKIMRLYYEKYGK